VGGVAGKTDASDLSNVHSTATTITQTSGNYAGGLFGYLSVSSLNNASAIANVQGGGSYAGGLIGHAFGAISNVSATGNLTAPSNDLGGLIGRASAGSVSAAFATGHVNGSSTGGSDRVGGLIGYADTSSVSNAYATGNVIGTISVGGLIGRADRDVSNTRASGNVTATANNAGGLIGWFNGGYTVKDSSSFKADGTPTVSGVGYVGGLIGLVDDVNAKVLGSYSNYAVTGSKDWVGGLVGHLDGTIADSTTAQPTARGSLHSYALGTVNGRYDVGGLVGRLASSGVIENA
jgi:hypothetical protein